MGAFFYNSNQLLRIIDNTVLRTGAGALLVPCGSWVLALWLLFGNKWIDLLFLVRKFLSEIP